MKRRVRLQPDAAPTQPTIAPTELGIARIRVIGIAPTNVKPDRTDPRQPDRTDHRQMDRTDYRHAESH